MDNKLTENEQRILSGVLEGAFPVFKVLRTQTDSLIVKSRKLNYRNYCVEFEVKSRPKVLTGAEANIEIEDTIFCVNESSGIFFVWVTVSEGLIRRLQIASDFDFESDFSIKEIFWRIRNKNPLKEGTLVKSADERDFERAIGYIPVFK